MRPELGAHYPSASQRTRVITEDWAANHLYCPACECNELAAERPGRKVVDFHCDSCSERYQLKARREPLRGQVQDAAYEPLAQAIRDGTAPSFFLMHYRLKDWHVQNLVLVPRFFLSLSAVVPRNPLGPKHPRKGHVLCNLALSQLPLDARIPVVLDGKAMPWEVVRSEWERFAFLQEKTHKVRGWTSDVLACVRRLSKSIFTAGEFYADFEVELRDLHPSNLHVKDKIRQQLQVLRRQGVLEFVRPGVYRQIRWCPACGHDSVPEVDTGASTRVRRLSCPVCGTVLW